MRKREPLYLTIDQGGHASRIIVFDPTGNIVSKSFASIGAHHPSEVRVEHDPEELIGSIHQALAETHQKLGSEFDRIVAAGLATQRSSIVCWDRNSGTPLSPVLSWQDRRAAGWLEQFRGQEELIRARTGLRLSPHYGVSKLHWCLEQLPEVNRALQEGRLAWGPMAGFLLFHLLDRSPHLVDPANGSRTLLCDLETLTWSQELLELFGLPSAPLPHCVPNRFNYGHLMLNGIDLPLTVTTGDQSAALYAYGRPQSDTLYINIGTGAFLQSPSSDAQPKSSRLLASVVFQDEDGKPTYVREGTVNGAGSALDWLQKELGLAPGELHKQLHEWLARKGSPPLFLNGVSGLGSPYWIADFQSRFIGDKAEVWGRTVAVLESVLFLLRVNIDELGHNSPDKRRIVISGGLAQLDGLCQRLADLSDMEVVRPDIREATALGLAYLLAGQPEVWPAGRGGTQFQPQPNPALGERYRHWHDAMARETGL